ncbi:MAG: hypothetical protein AB1390_10630 [Nitrospirota bacterium]
MVPLDYCLTASIFIRTKHKKPKGQINHVFKPKKSAVAVAMAIKASTGRRLLALIELLPDLFERSAAESVTQINRSLSCIFRSVLKLQTSSLCNFLRG